MIGTKMDYLTLSCCPPGEDATSAEHTDEARREVARYRKMLETRFPFPESLNGKVYFKVKWFPHDFGSYPEVCVFFDTETEEACDFAYWCDSALPERWTDEPLTAADFTKWREKRMLENFIDSH